VWAAIETLGSVAPLVADVGSGGGIPGIILGIVSPETNVILVERRQKKAGVLATIVSEMGLDARIKALARSFEEVKSFKDDTEYWFRGFLPGPKLAVYLSEHFPRADIGQLVLMKGPAWPNEKLDIMSEPKVKEAWLERFGSAAELNYSLPHGAGERILVLV
ncbi:MAG: class I SAM-dependent methyltransferase, partial [Deltaproteobacteria bacterium]|nr:class I SAM-dependent methyltransferase [Deltaproteobacteria bacterium]